jgi:hypothetical protein
MTDRTVAAFFYGSFINRGVLAEHSFTPAAVETACLWDFDIRIEPLATLVPADGRCVYGILCRATHAELDRLYGEAWVSNYRPEAVVVRGADGRLVPALCYIAPLGLPSPAAADYIDRIAGPAREYGFPTWYIERLKQFRPRPAGA